MINIRKLQALVAAVRKEPTAHEHLVPLVLAMADHVIELEREVDRLQAVATRAERQSRMMGGLRR